MAVRNDGPHRTVRLSDVAGALGLSACTVSRILSGRTGTAKYAPDTVRRVRLKAAQLGWQPNLVARPSPTGGHTRWACA